MVMADDAQLIAESLDRPAAFEELFTATSRRSTATCDSHGAAAPLAHR
jgi:hypothetical protein